jgi:hypothetical protein
VFPTKHPAVTPTIAGQPNKAASGIRQSATRSCTGPKDIGAKRMIKTAYKLVNTIVKLISVVFILYFTSRLRDFYCGTGGRHHLPATEIDYTNCLKTFTLTDIVNLKDMAKILV